jgi:hypothetical protein
VHCCVPGISNGLAPGLNEPPRPLSLWLAVVASNGEHHAYLNESVNGAVASGDATATMQVVAPDPIALAAWTTMPQGARH